MESRVISLKKAKKYEEIINIAFGMNPQDCESAELAHAIGKAFEKKNAFSQSIPWYVRSYEISQTDEELGMAIGVCLAIKDYGTVQGLLDKAKDIYEGYYYAAGCYELALRMNAGNDAEISALEAFLDIQEEESYMLRLISLYLEEGREKEAGRACKKLIRLFIGGEAVEYAEKLQDAIKEGDGLSFVKANPWTNDNVFKHLSFDMSVPCVSDVHVEPTSTTETSKDSVVVPDLSAKIIEQTINTEAVEEKKDSGLSATIAKLSARSSEKKEEKKERKDKISPIIEKCLEDVVGMHELKISMNTIFNMMQMNKKRVGNAILKNNVRILGPDGCGKTTAALAETKALSQIGIIGTDEPVITDYYALVGATSDETHENIQELFKNAENACILIENIHEFDDSGAYSLGLEAIDQLVKAYHAAEEKIPFIITGSENEVNALLKKKKKFGDLFNLPSVIVGKYSTEELVQIAHKIAEEKNLILDHDVDELLAGKFDHMAQQPDFKYSRDLNRIINEAYIHQVSRLSNVRRADENEYYLLKAEDFGSADTGETVVELLEELNRLTGLAEVKNQVNKIVNQVTVQKMREESGIGAGQGHSSLHLVFLGNAGTGKTTVARIIGKIYKRLGVLPSGQLIECTRRDLVSQYVGATSQKVADKVKEAMGGILFIDEAYTLCKDDNDTFGREAIDSLLTDIENHRDSLMVILAGYSADMSKFMDQNQGLRSRIPTDILFEDYSTDEMVQIFKKNVKDKGLILDAGLDEDVFNLLDSKKKKKDFGNARGVRNVFEAVVLNQNNRLGEMDPALISKNDFLIIRKEDLAISEEQSAPTKSVEDYLNELYALTGLASVKEKVGKIVASVQVNRKMAEAGMTTQGFGTLHMVFKGNAGTGKTTVARLIGNIYKELGVLSTGQLVECDRSMLVAGYTGQTAPKVKAKVQEAMGGVLFIDEAYTLASDSFGKEAIDTLVADIENYRNDLMVIIAGYSDDMDTFLSQNQGLKSRFPNEVVFEDYTVEEMLSIFKGMVKSRNLLIEDGIDSNITALIKTVSKQSDFGNARGIRNILDKICEQRNVRIAEIFQAGKEPTQEELQTIVASDLTVFGNLEQKTKSVDEYLAELNKLTGLASVKDKVNKTVASVRVNQEMKKQGLSTQGLGTLHMVFKGNAGTGKTTVARLLGGIYKELGVLSSGHLVECDRSMLVAGYVGQTAPKVKAKVQEAMGGILFIDEAYTLAKGGDNDPGKEAIDTLVADIENYRNDLMVIIAGYSDDMDIFLSQNQGLKSRFPNEIMFEDYSPEELLLIFKNNIKQRGLLMSDELDDKVVALISKYSKTSDFGNARGVRNLVDKLAEQRSVRISDIFLEGRTPTPEELQTVIEEDIQQLL